VKRNKNALYEDLKKLNKKLEKREKGIRRLSLQPPSATLTEDDLRIGEEFEEDLTDLLDELEDHEGISMKNLDATSWENIEEWTSEDVENADKRIRADTDWYKSYNDRLENVMLRENMDNIILHLKRLDVWNQQILYNVKTVPGVSEWAIEELNHRLNRASEKVASHYVSMRKTISDQVESFDDLELSNLNEHNYIERNIRGKDFQLLCINDSMISRLASELIFIDGLKERAKEMKERIKNRTSFYRKLIQGRLSIVEDNDSTLKANEVQQSLRNASTPPSRAPPQVPKESYFHYKLNAKIF
jgi:uncharacterized membrane-anchored protein YjiN (DUF445 family)